MSIKYPFKVFQVLHHDLNCQQFLWIFSLMYHFITMCYMCQFSFNYYFNPLRVTISQCGSVSLWILFIYYGLILRGHSMAIRDRWLVLLHFLFIYSCRQMIVLITIKKQNLCFLIFAVMDYMLYAYVCASYVCLVPVKVRKRC